MADGHAVALQGRCEDCIWQAVACMHIHSQLAVQVVTYVEAQDSNLACEEHFSTTVVNQFVLAAAYVGVGYDGSAHRLILVGTQMVCDV